MSTTDGHDRGLKGNCEFWRTSHTVFMFALVVARAGLVEESGRVRSQLRP